jgi:hypothetical protein
MDRIKTLFAKVREIAALNNGVNKHDPNPIRVWFTMLLGWSVVLVCSLAYSGYLYFVVQKDVQVEFDDRELVEVINRSELQATVSTYRERTIQFENVRRTPKEAPNPGGVVREVLPLPVEEGADEPSGEDGDDIEPSY